MHLHLHLHLYLCGLVPCRTSRLNFQILEKGGEEDSRVRHPSLFCWRRREGRRRRRRRRRKVYSKLTQEEEAEEEESLFRG